jgi:hypothetical protein
MAQVLFLENLYNGRVQRAYDTLHPAFQRLVPRSKFVQCTRQAALGGLDSIEILDVYDDPVTIPGAGQVPAKAVRIRLTSTTGDVASQTNHQVKVGNGWRWVMNDESLQAYRAGRCPPG